MIWNNRDNTGDLFLPMQRALDLVLGIICIAMTVTKIIDHTAQGKFFWIGAVCGILMLARFITGKGYRL